MSGPISEPLSGRVRQLAIDLPHQTAVGRADFLVSDSNAEAIAWIERWPDWPAGGLVLHGPAGGGKTHLVHVWRDLTGATILAADQVAQAEIPRAGPASRPAVAVDDADQAPEEALLHLYNRCREGGGTVLITARRPPGLWPIGLADLASRLRALVAVRIMPPDEALLGAVLVKHFADRQLRVAPEVIVYLVPRMERSFAAAAALAARLDTLALRRGRAITVPLVRRVLAEDADQSSAPPSDCGAT